MKAATVFLGLFFMGGFALGGIISYGSLISTSGGGNNGGSSSDRVTLPTENYRTSEYDLSMQERRQLAARNDVVFTSLLYNTTDQKERLEQMKGLETNFKGRMFIEVVDADETTKFITYGNSTPRAVVISARRGAGIVSEPTESSVGSAACNALINWGSAASFCTQYQ